MTAVDFLSAPGVSIIFGVRCSWRPSCCCLPAVAGVVVAVNFPAATNVPAIVRDPAVLSSKLFLSNHNSTFLDYQTVGNHYWNNNFFLPSPINCRLSDHLHRKSIFAKLTGSMVRSISWLDIKDFVK
jgi:hypothetical protein